MTSPSEQIVPRPIRIDIVSDVVCPWCIIGYKQLEHAQAETNVPAVVFWHPFELNPNMPEEGQNLFEHVAEKYGWMLDKSLEARSNLTEIGATLGFAFDYADDMRMVNTFRAHQILHWAATKDRQHQMKMALFEAVFTRRADVSNADVLCDMVASQGLDRNEAKAVLADARFADEVRQREAFWTSRGVQGVPAMVFNGRQALLGAQGIEAYKSMLLQLADDDSGQEDR